MIFTTPLLDDDDRRVIDEIDQLRDGFRHQISEPRRWTGQLSRSLVARSIQGSNSIEGIVVSVDDAEALVAGEELSPDIDVATRDAVTGYRDALTWVQQSPHMDNFHYDEMLLSALHFMIQKYDMGKWPGRYRPGAIYVTGPDPLNPVYTGPDAAQVPALMAELVTWLNEGDLDLPPLVRAAMAHLNLVSIHPWRDGNGRMSRCLHTLLLARERILAPEFSSIEEWLGADVNKLEYYQALQTTGEEWKPNTSAREWMRFCLGAHHRQAQLVQRRFDRATLTWTAMSEIVEAAGLPERVVTALYSAAVGQLRRTTYQRDENLTRDQAVRDVQALRRIGLVEGYGHARTRHYVAAGEAASRAEAVVERVRTGPITNPYRR